LRSIRWQLALSYFFIILFGMGLVGFYFFQTIRVQALRNMEENLTHYGFFIANLMGKHMEHAALTPPERRIITGEMNRLSEEIKGRICIVNWKGEILEDSAPSPEHGVGERPEIKSALRGEAGTAVRSEVGEKVPFMYVAVPMRAKEQLVGAIYLAKSTARIKTELQVLLKVLLQATFLSLLISGLLSYLLARFLTSPLLRMTAAARRLSEGHLEERIEVHSGNEIGKLAETFNQMAQSLQEQNRLLLQFVADASHELKTPLASIKSLSEVLQDGALDDPAAGKKFLGYLDNEINRMEHLVKDLLSLYKMEGRVLKMDIRPVDVRDLVIGLVEQLRPSFPGLELEVILKDEKHPFVMADPQRLRQVYSNLLENAARAVGANPEGCIRFGVEEREKDCLLSVIDNGIGITSEDLPHIFERFYRVDQGRSRREGGSGLGLAIVRQIVEAHGGRIWAESRPGEGSTFSFTLPLAGK